LDWSSEAAGRPFALIRRAHSCTSTVRRASTTPGYVMGVRLRLGPSRLACRDQLAAARRRVRTPGSRSGWPACRLPDSTQIQPRNATTRRKRQIVAISCL
jgi:hypothetical protein